jgi:hypothetical protein
MVQLDVLAGGDMPFSHRHPALDDVGEGVELVRRDTAEGQLDANHLHVGLALAVDALFEAEGDEVAVLALALEEAAGLGTEIVELVFEDRDHVPGDVLVALRVLPGTRSALPPLLLAVIDVQTVEYRDCRALGRLGNVHLVGTLPVKFR